MLLDNRTVHFTGTFPKMSRSPINDGSLSSETLAAGKRGKDRWSRVNERAAREKNYTRFFLAFPRGVLRTPVEDARGPLEQRM